ncbi:MAG: hypothetical protein WCF57_10760 [Pyrinomonadaceae bacterium]
MDSAYSAPPETARIQQLALVVGIICLLLLGVGFFLHPEQGFRSYLLGFVFWIGITLGCLAILMLQHMTGGAWGVVSRRVLEAGTRTLPLMALSFVPLIFGIHSLYHWADKAALQTDEIIRHKAKYLNVPFFLGRAGLYFVLWGIWIYFLNKWSQEQDRTADSRLTRRMAVFSGPGLIVFVLTVTFASIDWVMSLDPHWFSTIFGLLFVAGWALSCFAFVIAVLSLLMNRKPLAGVVGPSHFHDLGKLLLAFVMVWAYFNFSQYLIIWSGNIPEETRWYIYRTKGGWGLVGIALVLFHFALPFLLLLSRDLKRNARRLAIVAGVVLFMRLVDLFWLIAPKPHGETPATSYTQFHVSWMDFAAPLGLGGIWLWFFIWQLTKRPLLPFNDPQLEEAIEFGRHGGH